MRRLIGFSTGAIGDHDVDRGVSAIKTAGLKAVELSALRDYAFDAFIEMLSGWGICRTYGFDYVSVHAPSRFTPEREREIVEKLDLNVTFRSQLDSSTTHSPWPIVLHPDAIHNLELWRRFGPSLLLENLGSSKASSRTADEMTAWFDKLPEAGWCFDIAHSHQVDPTGGETLRLLQVHGCRLREVHISRVEEPKGQHFTLDEQMIEFCQRYAHLIPDTCPIIIESPIEADQITQELQQAQTALTTTK
jgi:sugar phosphate isomerase/epimerase